MTSVPSESSSSPPSPPPPARRPQSYSPKTRNQDRHYGDADTGATETQRRSSPPRLGVVTGRRKQQQQQQRHNFFKSSSLSPSTTSPMSMASSSNNPRRLRRQQQHQQQQPQRHQQHRRTTSSSSSPQNTTTTDAMVETFPTRTAGSSYGGDSIISCCSSSYYSEYTIDDEIHPSSCHMVNQHHHHHIHHQHRRLSSSHDEYEFEEYIIEEREDEEEEEEEEEIVVLDDDDGSDVETIGGDDNDDRISRNSWDSSINDEYGDHRLTETTLVSLGELSAHTLSTAFTLNDLASIETVSSLDVDDDRDDKIDGFGLIDDDDDDDEEDVDCEYPKMVEPMTDNTTTMVKTSEVLYNDVDGMMNKVDDISLDTVERERRRIDKHTEAHELREVFCHPPTIIHNKEQRGGTSHQQRQEYPPSHAQDVDMDRIIRSMHKSLNLVGSNSEILMDRGKIFQRRHSF